MSDLSWSVYILKCRDDSFYVGIASDPVAREHRHNEGKGSAWTKARRPVRLVFAEQHPGKSRARKREIEIKGWRREKKQALIESARNARGCC